MTIEPMKTNRDLYKSIERLLKQKRDQSIPSLECYLSNLRRRASQMAHRETLSLEEFFLLLRDSFDVSEEMSDVVAVENGLPLFYEWQAAVTGQIRDLREMAENKQLEDPYRSLGIDAPSGCRWYNFDPHAYIECGVAGALGGWEEGDETGRVYVPGKVACLDADGKITVCDPREIDLSPVEVPIITWKQFLDFVWCGQNYE